MPERATKNDPSSHVPPQAKSAQLTNVSYDALFLENIQLKKENKALKCDAFCKWILLCSAFGLGTTSLIFSILGVLAVEDESLRYAGLGVSTLSFCLTLGGSTKDCITQAGKKMWDNHLENEEFRRNDFSLD